MWFVWFVKFVDGADHADYTPLERSFCLFQNVQALFVALYSVDNALTLQQRPDFPKVAAQPGGGLGQRGVRVSRQHFVRQFRDSALPGPLLGQLFDCLNRRAGLEVLALLVVNSAQHNPAAGERVKVH